MRAFFSIVLVFAFIACLLRMFAVYCEAQSAALQVKTAVSLHQGISDRIYSLEAEFRAKVREKLPEALARQALEDAKRLMGKPYDSKAGARVICSGLGGWQPAYVSRLDYSPLYNASCEGIVRVDSALLRARIRGDGAAFYRGEAVGPARMLALVPEGTTVGLA